MYNVEEIRNIVQGLREFYPALDFDSTLQDLEGAIEQFGVNVKYSFMNSENRNVSGYLMVENHEPVIVLNAADSEKRRRFTMAHELGHLILHWNWLPGDSIEIENGVFDISYRKESRGDYDSLEDLEREDDADTFAGEFLLPVNKVVDISKSTSSVEKIVDQLVAKYNVSAPCAFVRVRNLRREGEI